MQPCPPSPAPLPVACPESAARCAAPRTACGSALLMRISNAARMIASSRPMNCGRRSPTIAACWLCSMLCLYWSNYSSSHCEPEALPRASFQPGGITMTRPRNWYELTYEQQCDWQRGQREREDLEYDRDR